MSQNTADVLGLAQNRAIVTKDGPGLSEGLPVTLQSKLVLPVLCMDCFPSLGSEAAANRFQECTLTTFPNYTWHKHRLPCIVFKTPEISKPEQLNIS